MKPKVVNIVSFCSSRTPIEDLQSRDHIHHIHQYSVPTQEVLIHAVSKTSHPSSERSFRFDTMSLVGRILPLLTLVFLFSSLAVAWTVWIFEEDQCGDDANNFGETGDGSWCIFQGGNSWQVLDSDVGCVFSSWSGNVCRGSSTPPNDSGQCHDVPFASIEVSC